MVGVARIRRTKKEIEEDKKIEEVRKRALIGKTKEEIKAYDKEYKKKERYRKASRTRARNRMKKEKEYEVENKEIERLEKLAEEEKKIEAREKKLLDQRKKFVELTLKQGEEFTKSIIDFYVDHVVSKVEKYYNFINRAKLSDLLNANSDFIENPIDFAQLHGFSVNIKQGKYDRHKFISRVPNVKSDFVGISLDLEKVDFMTIGADFFTKFVGHLKKLKSANNYFLTQNDRNSLNPSEQAEAILHIIFGEPVFDGEGNPVSESDRISFKNQEYYTEKVRRGLCRNFIDKITYSRCNSDSSDFGSTVASLKLTLNGDVDIIRLLCYTDGATTTVEEFKNVLKQYITGYVAGVDITNSDGETIPATEHVYGKKLELSPFIINHAVYKKIIQKQIQDQLNNSGEFLKDKIKDLSSYTGLNAVVSYEGSKKLKRRKNAGFFPYRNISNIDLKMYGIYNNLEEVRENSSTNCFYYACEQEKLNPIGRAELDALSILLAGKLNLKITELPEVAKCIERFINLRCWSTVDESKKSDDQGLPQMSKKGKTYGDRNYKPLSVLLCDGHYMNNESLPFNSFYLENSDIIENVIEGLEKDEPDFEGELAKCLFWFLRKQKKNHDCDLHTIKYRLRPTKDKMKDGSYKLRVKLEQKSTSTNLITVLKALKTKGLLVPINSHEIYETIRHDDKRLSKEFENLEYTENNTRAISSFLPIKLQDKQLKKRLKEIGSEIKSKFDVNVSDLTNLEAYAGISNEESVEIFCNNEKKDWTTYIDVQKTLIGGSKNHAGTNLVESLKKFDSKIFKKLLTEYLFVKQNKIKTGELVKKYSRNVEFKHIYVADFESDPTVVPHKPYLCILNELKDELGVTEKIFLDEDYADKPDPILSLVTALVNSMENHGLCYFHNLRYDASFILNKLYGSANIVEKSGSMMRIKYFIPTSDGEGKHITFADSCCLIPQKLAEFPDMFNLEAGLHKEMMPYTLYTEVNRAKRFVSVVDFVACYLKEYKQRKYLEPNTEKTTLKENKKKNQIMNSLVNSGALYGTEVNIIDYAIYYCRFDVKILRLGLLKFNENITKIINDKNIVGTEPPVEVWKYYSLASISYDFCRRAGCFDGCFELSGKPQAFIMKCIAGGRVMCANNERINHKAENVDKTPDDLDNSSLYPPQLLLFDKLNDLDVNALYPYAQRLMNGIPKGTPKILSKEQCLKLSQDANALGFDDYFVQIKVTEITAKLTPKSNGDARTYRFPMLSHCEKGIKTYIDLPTESTFQCKRSLLDLIEFYDIKYEVINGYYFDEGFNSKIGEVTNILYDQRKLCKAYEKLNGLKAMMSECYKLIMSSSYGKSVLKPIKTNSQMLDRGEQDSKMNDYLYRNFQIVNEIRTCVDSRKMFVKTAKPIVNHFNLPQFGVNVYAWSKRHMNCLMCLADQLSIKIFYQDTDSMILEDRDIAKLTAAFESKYGDTLLRHAGGKLIGKELGQLSADFDPLVKDGKSPLSVWFIALGKKMYIHKLEDEDGNTGYHVRMKGVCKSAIDYYTAKNNIDIMDMFKKIHDGETTTFNLLEGGVRFVKGPMFSISTRTSFPRKVKATADVQSGLF